MARNETGTFIVDASGEVEVDFLFDGGWFRGELAMFSLEGMEAIEPGSTEFMLEAARRALTDSTQGRIIVQDELEAARFSADLAWERNFNSGIYQGVKTFQMTPGDEVAFMLSLDAFNLDYLIFKKECEKASAPCLLPPALPSPIAKLNATKLSAAYYR